MLFCKNCGATIEDTATTCPFCQTPVSAQAGAPQGGYQQPVYQQPYQPATLSAAALPAGSCG